MGEVEFKSRFVLDFKATFILLTIHCLGHEMDRNANEGIRMHKHNTHIHSLTCSRCVYREDSAVRVPQRVPRLINCKYGKKILELSFTFSSQLLKITTLCTCYKYYIMYIVFAYIIHVCVYICVCVCVCLCVCIYT